MTTRIEELITELVQRAPELAADTITTLGPKDMMNVNKPRIISRRAAPFALADSMTPPPNILPDL